MRGLTRLGRSDSDLAALAARGDGFDFELVDGFYVADGSSARAHDDGVGLGGVALEEDGVEEVAAGDAGGGEDYAVADAEVFGGVYFVEVFLFEACVEEFFFSASSRGQSLT